MDRAAGGESIVVTDRGHPTAVLGPVGGGMLLQRGVADGWISPPSGSGLTPFVPGAAVAASSTALADDRGE